MHQLLAAALTTTQQSNLNVIGELQAILPDFKEIRKTKNAYSRLLTTNDGKQLPIVLSKPLSAAIAAGQVSEAQFGYCNVIASKNAQQEDRFYLTLPVDFRGGESVQTFLAKVAAAQRPKLAFDAQAAASAI